MFWICNFFNKQRHSLTSSGSSNQLLSPECWKVTLRVLGCLPPSRQTKSKAGQAHSTTDVSGRAVGHSASPCRGPISLSPQQVTNVGVNRVKPLYRIMASIPFYLSHQML